MLRREEGQNSMCVRTYVGTGASSLPQSSAASARAHYTVHTRSGTFPPIHTGGLSMKHWARQRAEPGMHAARPGRPLGITYRGAWGGASLARDARQCGKIAQRARSNQRAGWRYKAGALRSVIRRRQAWVRPIAAGGGRLVVSRGANPRTPLEGLLWAKRTGRGPIARGALASCRTRARGDLCLPRTCRTYGVPRGV
ncbi:hypothetical protein C8Q78DRAFT_241008 [Trametes maxima]|nr:hypothetical protein C8Q78DRAFT_241008 [Trametes maxima]